MIGLPSSFPNYKMIEESFDFPWGPQECWTKTKFLLIDHSFFFWLCEQNSIFIGTVLLSESISVGPCTTFSFHSFLLLLFLVDFVVVRDFRVYTGMTFSLTKMCVYEIQSLLFSLTFFVRGDLRLHHFRMRCWAFCFVDFILSSLTSLSYQFLFCLFRVVNGFLRPPFFQHGSQPILLFVVGLSKTRLLCMEF